MSTSPEASILCIDSRAPDTIRLVKSSLSDIAGVDISCTIAGADALDRAFAVLTQETIDVVLMSWDMCDESGGRVIEEIVLNYDVPVIVLTDTDDSRIASQAFQHHATDCVPRHSIEGSDAFRAYIKTIIQQREIRKETEQSLLGGDLFVERVLDTFDALAIIVVDLQNNIVFFNEGAEKLLGYSAREVVGKKSIEIIYPTDDARTAEAIDNAREYICAKKQGLSIEIQVAARDGKRAWLNMNLTPRHDSAGNIIGMLGISEDITERKHSEESLLKSNERYRTLLQLIPDIVYIIDPDGNFSFVSDSISVLGYTPQELLGKHFKAIIHREDFPNVARDYVLPRYKGMVTGDIHSPKLFDERRSGQRMTTNLEVRLVPKEGSASAEKSFVGIISAVNASGHYSRDDQGNEFLGTIGVIRDITERKLAEEEHRRLEEQLNQAHKMEAIGRLAGGIAHDFNNMLSGIMGYAEVIKRRNKKSDGTVVDTELDRHIDVIIRATERAGDLTEKLLAFSRQGKYQLVPVHMHDTIKEVKGLLEHTIDKRIKIRQKLNAEETFVLGDPTQLQNAILNLAMNARDAMPNGGELGFETSVITVDEQFAESLTFHMVPGRYLLLKVSDTGIGMDKQTQNKVFEPFFTTKDIGEGVGLGLSSVYGTVKSHSGAILVDSSVGRGTVFSVYLPIHEEGREVAESEQKTVEKGAGKILVVDDEEIVRTILAQLLEELGYTITSCANGGEAIEYYQQYSSEVDLVILDMNMPVMSGAECLAKLREINENVKVIISTGYSFQSKTQKILATGISGFVKKPFKLADLSEEIQRVMAEE